VRDLLVAADGASLAASYSPAGDTVVVMGAETVRDTPDSAVLRRRYTNVWRREGNTWRLFIRHANIVVGQGPA